MTAVAVPEELKRPLSHLIVWVVVGGLLAWAHGGAEINFMALWTNGHNIRVMLGDFFPPDLSNWATYFGEMAVTVQISLWGTFMAIVAAVPLGLLGAKNISPPAVVIVVRRIMDACRAINEMVFALLFVAAVGLGPFAGVLALFVHTAGTLGKLFSEAVEAIDPRTVEGIRATGAGQLAAIRFGVLPQVAPLWLSYTLYRFESNVRSATVLGIVGAGGIGQSLYESIRAFNYQQSCTILIIIIACVIIMDMASARLRAMSI